jgi:hypothetical protein
VRAIVIAVDAMALRNPTGLSDCMVQLKTESK